MSIIHDALKKVQQTNNAGLPTPPTPSQETAPSPETAKAQDKTSLPLLVAVICAVVAMIFAALPQFTPKKTTAPSTPVAAAPVSPAVPTKQPVPEPAAPSTNTISKAVANAVAAPTQPPSAPVQKIVDPNDPLSSIQIEGVMDMGGKKAVLINGNVYEEGQTIHGRIISSITFDSLTVMENGQKRIFPIKP